MRVYELAEELDQSSQELLRLLNQELDQDINSHMSSVDERTARTIRLRYASGATAVFKEFTGLLSDREQVKSLFGSALDRLSFSVGLGLLLMPDKGDETREKIRDEIRDLGKEITDPIKIGGEEIIDLVSVIPDQLDRFKDQALETGAERFEQLSPFVQGAVDEAKHLVESSKVPGISANGEASPEPHESSR